jgi:hypothetical protein
LRGSSGALAVSVPAELMPPTQTVETFTNTHAKQPPCTLHRNFDIPHSNLGKAISYNPYRRKSQKLLRTHHICLQSSICSLISISNTSITEKFTFRFLNELISALNASLYGRENGFSSSICVASQVSVNGASFSNFAITIRNNTHLGWGNDFVTAIAIRFLLIVIVTDVSSFAHLKQPRLLIVERAA